MCFVRRLLCVTWHPLPSTCMSPQKGPLTSKSLHLSPKSLSGTSIRSLTSTTTQCLRFVFFSDISSLSSIQLGLMCSVLTNDSSLLLYRLKGQTCATGQLESACRVWLMPSSLCVIHLKAQRPNCSTFRSSRQSTTLP